MALLKSLRATITDFLAPATSAPPQLARCRECGASDVKRAKDVGLVAGTFHPTFEKSLGHLEGALTSVSIDAFICEKCGHCELVAQAGPALEVAPPPPVPPYRGAPTAPPATGNSDPSPAEPVPPPSREGRRTGQSSPSQPAPAPPRPRRSRLGPPQLPFKRPADFSRSPRPDLFADESLSPSNPQRQTHDDDAFELGAGMQLTLLDAGSDPELLIRLIGRLFGITIYSAAALEAATPFVLAERLSRTKAESRAAKLWAAGADVELLPAGNGRACYRRPGPDLGAW